MPAITQKKSALSWLRKHPIVFVLTIVFASVMVMVIIAVYTGPPQTIRSKPRRREEEFTPEPAPALAVAAPAVPFRASRLSERLTGAALVAAAVIASIIILKILKLIP